MSQVKQEWVEVTRFVLVEKAAEHNTITYGELYDHLRTIYFPTWRSRHNGHSWMQTTLSPILGEVANLNRIYEEPILTALVRNGDTGMVGPGYANAVMNRYGASVERWHLHAQVEAAKCFRHFGIPK